MTYHYVNKMGVEKFLVTKETSAGVEVSLFNENNGEFLGTSVVTEEQLKSFLLNYKVKEGDTT